MLTRERRYVLKSPNDKFRIIIADDHPVFRAGLKSIIESNPQYRVVGEANNGRELIEKIGSNTCDMVILDLSMPETHGLEVLAEIKKNFPEIRVLIVTMHKEREYFKYALTKGVDGYILKNEVAEKIVSSIQSIQSGLKSYSSEILSFIVDNYSVILDSPITMELLSKREKQVLKLIVAGKTSRDIAKELGISKRTVDVHRAKIMEKLQIENIAELVKFSISHGLV